MRGWSVTDSRHDGIVGAWTAPPPKTGSARTSPARVAEVLGHDEERAWLLLADAGTPIGVVGNPPEAWLVALPLYALPPTDPWFARLRDAYLEPWGRGLADTFALAIRVGTFAHTFAHARQWDALPDEARPEFDKTFPIVLRRAVAQTLE